MGYNTTTLTLPSGATVEIKDPRTLLMKDRKAVLAAADKDTKVAMATGMQEGLIAVMVESWSFDLIPPSVSVASLEMLTPADYEALLEASMVAQTALFPSLAADTENIDDPKAITESWNDLKTFGEV